MSFEPFIQNRRGFLSTLAKGIGVLASPDAVTNVAKAAGRSTPNQPLKAGLGHVYRALLKTTGDYHEYSPGFSIKQREHITQIAMAALHKVEKEDWSDEVVGFKDMVGHFQYYFDEGESFEDAYTAFEDDNMFDIYDLVKKYAYDLRTVGSVDTKDLTDRMVREISDGNGFDDFWDTLAMKHGPREPGEQRPDDRDYLDKDYAQGPHMNSAQVSFKDFHNLNEAFDKPYSFNVDSSEYPLTVYNFTVDDVDDPYTVQAVFDPVDTLDQFIEPERDSAGIAKQDHRQAVKQADRYIAFKYPSAIKPEYAKVIEYGFSDKGSGSIEKTGKGGHSATRVIGTVIQIAQHYMITREPKVLLFTGAKDENRGPIYTKLTHLAFRSLKDGALAGYNYYIDDHLKGDVRFWIYKEDDVPYLGDENFQKYFNDKR